MKKSLALTLLCALCVSCAARTDDVTSTVMGEEDGQQVRIFVPQHVLAQYDVTIDAVAHDVEYILKSMVAEVVASAILSDTNASNVDDSQLTLPPESFDDILSVSWIETWQTNSSGAFVFGERIALSNVFKSNGEE